MAALGAVVEVDNPRMGSKGTLKVAGTWYERSPRNTPAVVVDPRHLNERRSVGQIRCVELVEPQEKGFVELSLPQNKCRQMQKLERVPRDATSHISKIDTVTP